MTPIFSGVRRCFALLAFLFTASASAAPPIVIGISAEYGLKGSQAAQSIEKGIKVAIEEINARGGLLGGRPLALETRDDRGVPARGIDNLKELAGKPEVIAVFCGRFSPVAIEQAPVANREGILLLDPWAAANGIANNGANPNYVFRLSMTDTWAMNTLADYAIRKKLNHIALFLPNTAWGRSSLAAFDAYTAKHAQLNSNNYWYNWGDMNFSEQLTEAREKGAKAILMVANESEGAIIVKTLAELPANQRLPVIAHWGITGGNFADATGAALDAVDLQVVQTFTFHDAKGARVKPVARNYQRLFGEEAGTLQAAVGFAHAYDLTHLLAMAITKAGTTARPAVRHALENLGSYVGLVRNYNRPFSPENHEALDQKQVFLARFARDGTLFRTQDK
jgi:branched-chain amino acid transport system substrate-binding protein